MFSLLAVNAAAAGEDMSTWITTITEVFTSMFSAAWTMITGNWFLLAGVTIPLVASLLFAIVAFFRSRS